MSRALDSLNPMFRPLAFEFLARLTEADIHVKIVDTLRTPAEHEANLIAGVSWTKHSKHLDGAAIDVCPYAEWMLRGHNKLQWDAGDPIWRRIGAIGETIGLVWGGRWKLVKDLGHFEMPSSGIARGGLDA